MNCPSSTPLSSEPSEEQLDPTLDIISSRVVRAEPDSQAVASGQSPIDDGDGLCQHGLNQMPTDADDDDNNDDKDDGDE